MCLGDNVRPHRVIKVWVERLAEAALDIEQSTLREHRRHEAGSDDCDGREALDGTALAPLLLGQDPMNRIGLWEQLFHSLYNGNNAVGLAGSAISALDIALWDLAGKATGLPVSQLLGGEIVACWDFLQRFGPAIGVSSVSLDTFVDALLARERGPVPVLEAALALVRPQPTTTPYVRVQGGGLDHPPLTRG